MLKKTWELVKYVSNNYLDCSRIAHSDSIKSGYVIVLIIEFVLGLAFGYYFRKLITALLGLMILGFVGVALNYAQFMMLKDVLVEHLDIGAGTLMDVIGLITIVLGLTVLAPLAIGLIIGYLIGR